MNVFSSAAQLDDLANRAFDKIKEKYGQFLLEYNEDGVTVLNFDSCTEEETGGWSQEQVENNLTDELLEEMNNLSA